METERTYVDKDNLLGLCRLAYMLIIELVENKEKKDNYLDLVDEMVNEILLTEDKTK